MPPEQPVHFPVQTNQLMSKKSLTKPSEEDLEILLCKLNLFFGENTAWFSTYAKKTHIDLFGDLIPVDATYYKRLAGRDPRPVMILSQQSLSRFYQCLAEANPLFDMLAEILRDEDGLQMEERKDPNPASSD